MKRPHFSILKDYKDGTVKHLRNKGTARRHDLSLKETRFGQVAVNRWVLRTCAMCEELNHNKQMEKKKEFYNNAGYFQISSHILCNA
jgi:hypothetical protein